MKRNSLTSVVIIFLCFAGFSPVKAVEPDARITVQADKLGANISPLLYGIFFEEINRAGDGGLYAEMLQNRSFEDAPTPLGWTLEESAGNDVCIASTYDVSGYQPAPQRE